MNLWKSWMELPDGSAVWTRTADKEAFSSALHAEGRLGRLRFVTESDFSGWFAEDALLFLETTRGIGPHHGAKILPWLDFVGGPFDSPTAKIAELRDLRSVLEAAGKYVAPDHSTWNNRTVWAINRPNHPRYPEVKIQDRFSWTRCLGEIPLLECPDEEAQVHAVIETIARLLSQGVAVTDIRLVNASPADQTRLVLEAGLYGFTISEERRIPLNRFPLVARLSHRLGSTPLQSLLEEVVSPPASELERRVASALMDIVNRYGISSLEQHFSLFQYEMSVQTVGIPADEGAVLLIGLDEMVPDPGCHYLLMNYTDSVLPPVHQDTDYLSDAEKQILGQPTSLETNEVLRDQTLRLLDAVPELSLFYAKKMGGHEARIADLELSRPLSRQEYAILATPNGFSRDYDRVLYAKRNFSWNRYGIRTEDQPLLRASHAASWHAFDPRFNGIRTERLSSLLQRGIPLSPTSLETFYQCRFRYFLRHLLRLGERETSLELSLGNLAHHVLSQAFSTPSSVSELAAQYRRKDPLLQEEIAGFLADLFAKRLETVVERLKIRRSHSAFTDFSVEQTYSYLHPEDPDFRVVGKIDLVQIYRADPEAFVTVIDYKTGNNVFREDDFWKGVDLQLLFYLHLLSRAGAIPGMKPAGFYYQPVNLGRISKDPKKDPIKEKLKMNGMTLKDSRIAFGFDPDGDVRGLTFKADGEFHAKAKVADAERMETLLHQMQTFLDEAVRWIRNGSFDINPLPPRPNRPGSESCDYCPYQGICYLANSSETIEDPDLTEGDE